MEIVFLFIGFFFGLIANVSLFSETGKAKAKAVKDYFGSPVDGKLELDWSMKQFLSIFSKGMSDRWYEARAHLKTGVGLALLCTFGIVKLVRFDYMYEHDDAKGRFENTCYAYWALPGNAKKRIQELQAEAEELGDELSKKDQPLYLYQIFIAGENVVWDYMNGGLGKYRKPEDFFPVM